MVRHETRTIKTIMILNDLERILIHIFNTERFEVKGEASYGLIHKRTNVCADLLDFHVQCELKVD